MYAPFRCPRVETFSDLAGAPALPLRQTWLPEPSAGFQSGEVRCGWRPDAFCVEALLTDRDVYNPETRFNEPAFLRGDVFEMFLQPPGGEVYYEFHVGPANQVFQLRIPSVETFAARRELGPSKDWLLGDRRIDSRVALYPEEGVWRVWAELPVEMMDRSELESGERWRLSFCRYDYNRNPDELMHSSTSPITQLDFHRLSEWGECLVV